METAIRLEPTFADAHYELANLHREQRQLAQAIEGYRQTIRLRPSHVGPYNNLAIVLRDLGRLDEAAQCCRQALAVDPACAEAHSNLGFVLQDQQLLDEAVAAHQQAIRLRPDLAAAHSALGTALQLRDRFDEAEAAYRRAMELEPRNIVSRHNLAMALLEKGEPAAASRILDEMLRIEPEHAEAHYWLAATRLGAGDFARGWPEYEWRRKMPGRGSSHAEPAWDGSDLRGERILIHAEWGLGDTLHFIRYVPLVQQRGGDVFVEVQRSLIPLLQASGFGQLVAAGDKAPPCDVQVPLLSLPGIFATTFETIPARVPYFFAKPELIDAWQQSCSMSEG